MSKLQRVMIANGLLVMLVSMFAGFMLMFNLLGGFEIWPGQILEFSVYGTTEGWVRAHSGDECLAGDGDRLCITAR